MKNTKQQQMNEEKQWKEAARQMAEQIHMSEASQDRILESIHMEIRKREGRSINMRRISGKKVVLAVALVAALAAGTAVGAGKIAYLSSGHSVNQIDYANAKEVMESEKLGGLAKAVQTFADGTAFKAGYYTDVEAQDENRNKVGTYPEISVMYGKNLTLTINRPLDGVGSGLYPIILSEEYEGIPIKVERMDYLFLPAGAKPSEEDQKRLEEGSLEISYGTDKEERTVFLGATWEEDGIKYLLFTMKGGFSEEDLLAKAKEVIDVER